jgi:tetratricopeptide (TPR) repeat protein
VKIRRSVLGIALLFILPAIVTVMAFFTLAAADPADIVAGTPLAVTPTTLPDTVTPLAQPDPNEIYRAAVAAYESGNYVLAEERFRAALVLAPGDANLHNSLGLTLVQQGRPEEAIAEYEMAVTLDPALAEAHYNLGMAHHALKQWAEAEAAYQAALAADPTLALAHNGLGNLYHDQGQAEAALAAYQLAVTHGPELGRRHT